MCGSHVHYIGVGLIRNKHSSILPPSKRREDIHPPPSEEWCLIMEVWVLYSKLQNVKNNDTAYLHWLKFIIRILYTQLQQS